VYQVETTESRKDVIDEVIRLETSKLDISDYIT
jgi:hypothetical protein